MRFALFVTGSVYEQIGYLSHWGPYAVLSLHFTLQHGGVVQVGLKLISSGRDQPNSQFHGCDISVKLAVFRENARFRDFSAFTFIYEGFQSFVKPPVTTVLVCPH